MAHMSMSPERPGSQGSLVGVLVGEQEGESQCVGGWERGEGELVGGGVGRESLSVLVGRGRGEGESVLVGGDVGRESLCLLVGGGGAWGGRAQCVGRWAWKGRGSVFCVVVGTVHDIVTRGGRCLIPVFALGRAQELLLILGMYMAEACDALPTCQCGIDEYWAAHPELHDVPIYYASSLAQKCMAGKNVTSLWLLIVWLLSLPDLYWCHE